MDIDLMICGHVHRDLYYEHNEVVKYPVLVNSNMGSVEVNTHGDTFEAVVRHLDGKVHSKREFRAK
jgi:UDP-2,3-diacylglucosamine pyrophosphatase LpxH